MRDYSVIRCKNLIKGEMLESTSEDFIRSMKKNPATGELVGLAPNSGIQAAREAIESARAAFDRSDWSRTPIDPFTLPVRKCPNIDKVLCSHFRFSHTATCTHMDMKYSPRRDPFTTHP
jgi:hypothetical protein